MTLARSNRGFTLIELLLTVVILAIVIGIAVPSFQAMVLNNRIISQVNEATSLISYARSEASKLQDAVITVCPSTDGSSCANSAAWEGGWIVMRDADGDRTLDTGDGDEILRVFQGLAGGNTLRVSGLSSSGGTYIQFAGNGYPVPESLGASPVGTISICDSRGAGEAKAIVVSVSGQTRLARDSDNDGVLNDHGGNNVSCP
ncbi:MAG: GspH/FimT family pseudopilin [Marinobacter sp.]|nr:GspH/FimT family pseudopilin [Marinobacter sp.]